MPSITLRNLGDDDDLLSISGLTASPAAPKPGDTLQFTINGTTSEEITDGAYVDLTVKLGLIKLLHKTLDLFSELRASSTGVGQTTANLTVPQQKDSVIPAGDFTLTATITLPREVPRACFSVIAAFWNADEADIATIEGRLDLTR